MIAISFISVDDVSNRNLNELDSAFMYTRILKGSLFEIEYDEQSLKDFITYCQTIFEDNDVTLNRSIQFEKEYTLKSLFSGVLPRHSSIPFLIQHCVL